MSRWYNGQSFTAKAPTFRDKDTWEVGIRENLILLAVKKGNTKKLARAQLVKGVVTNPDRILEGWKRPEYGDCFVYVGKPTKDWHDATIELPPPPNNLFLVFVLPDGTIDDWGWRPHEDGDPSMPCGMNHTHGQDK